MFSLFQWQIQHILEARATFNGRKGSNAQAKLWSAFSIFKMVSVIEKRRYARSKLPSIWTKNFEKENYLNIFFATPN